MFLNRTFLTIGLSLALTGCIKQPEACLKADKTVAAVNETITVTSCSSDAARFLWTSDKATIVSGGDFCSPSVSLKYASPGTYTVNLDVSNYRGKADCNSTGTNKSDNASITITVQ
jgi:PKD repeat protein